jgi:serine/threonine protein kinase
VKVFGVAEGVLTPELANLFHVSLGDEAVGIVLRYEGGGSLGTLIHHPTNTIAHRKVTLIESVRLLRDIARGLTELHAIGIVHGDIKPDNILLSSQDPPMIRMADFGLSQLSNENGTKGTKMNHSTLAQTKHLRGTPIYCAPEMLIDPLTDFAVASVARSSRKTDMYAFGLLAWEVLSQKTPFADCTNEVMLCSRVHRGIRPSLDDLPEDTPVPIVEMIVNCWSSSRDVRYSASECLAVLVRGFGSLKSSSFNALIVSEPQEDLKKLPSGLFQVLNRNGYSVWYDARVQQSADGATLMEGLVQNYILVMSASSLVSQEYCQKSFRRIMDSSASPASMLEHIFVLYLNDSNQSKAMALEHLEHFFSPKLASPTQMHVMMDASWGRRRKSTAALEGTKTKDGGFEPELEDDDDFDEIDSSDLRKLQIELAPLLSSLPKP